jgi:hypothetical protein
LRKRYERCELETKNKTEDSEQDRFHCISPESGWFWT